MTIVKFIGHIHKDVGSIVSKKSQCEIASIEMACHFSRHAMKGKRWAPCALTLIWMGFSQNQGGGWIRAIW